MIAALLDINVVLDVFLKGFVGTTVAVMTPADLLARISKAPHA